MSKVAGLLSAATLILLTGCTGGTPAPSATVTAPVPDSQQTTASDPTSTSTARIPGAACLNGTWRLVRFVVLAEQSTYGTGQGGDVTVTFHRGGYTLIGKGKKPIRVDLAGRSASLRMDGTVKGSYGPDGGMMRFTVGKATGEGTLVSGAQRQTLPMASIAKVVAPSGKATVACPKHGLAITVPTMRLELER